MLSVFIYIAVRKFLLQFASTKGILFLSIVNVLTFSLALDYLLNSNFLHKSLFNITLLFCSFWFVSIFIFLYKKSLYSTHTTVIQRFWKRTLYLFWVIELFLFMIYMYLVLVAPTEVEWLLDQPQLFRTK